MPTLAEAVVRARALLDISQEKLAEKAGMTPGWVGQVEAGDIKKPKKPTLRKLAKALGVTYASLVLAVYEADDENIEVRLQEIAVLPTAQARRAAFEDLPPLVQRSILLLMNDRTAEVSGQIEAALEQLDQGSQK